MILIIQEGRVGNDQEKANQNEISTPKTEVGKPNLTIRFLEKYCKPSEQLFPNRRPLSYSNLNKI